MIGNPGSLTEESHAADHDGLLEGPTYTKPPSWRGLDVPEVLLSGHHERVAAWRRDQAVARTRQRRPELLPLSELVIEPASPDDAGELWTLQLASYLSEGQVDSSLSIPPLTQTSTRCATRCRPGPFSSPVAAIGSSVQFAASRRTTMFGTSDG